MFKSIARYRNYSPMAPIPWYKYAGQQGIIGIGILMATNSIRAGSSKSALKISCLHGHLCLIFPKRLQFGETNVGVITQGVVKVMIESD